MRSARTLFATAAVTAVLTVTAPSAYAIAVSNDGGHDSGSSSRSEEHGKSDEGGKYKDEDNEKPRGGVHTGGGALASTVAKEWQPDSDEGGKSAKSDDEGWKKDKPSGGMHTGGGAMAMTGSGLAAGSLLLLGGVGVGAYKLRRRQATGGAMA
ncbi:hypothetical protein [Streptomyces sp. ITFR-6]|uniref:hypothetical protein n=1 Tax=Streptomyces sp. ITFR-6 TaxID=3075197 RepID=UPI00288B29AB|nr:hypothetical protein [Streptomyces sp. ITFR-6]WNI29457.1 hypothetical protein RLT59_12155 [Streptomyces sp. ITFR-6]